VQQHPRREVGVQHLVLEAVQALVVDLEDAEPLGGVNGVEPLALRTDRCTELEERDRRFARIRVRDLLSMSSGIRYEEGGMPWSDDAVAYYGTNLREVALEDTEIEQVPRMGWHYNNFNPLLLGLILERATGVAVANYMETRLWRPMGAEADASWSLDSEDSGFEKMESGVNARARDFARFGLLMLRGGRAETGRVVAPGWVRAATVDRSGYFGYGLGWWVEAGSRGGRLPFWPGVSTGRSSSGTPRMTRSSSGWEATTPASTGRPWRSMSPHG
jgi:CubicO group peptidase (beta-lactamase class C family)